MEMQAHNACAMRQANGAIKLNVLRKVLSERQVDLPSQPEDYSSLLEDAGVKIAFIVVMTGRSGSTWLASALEQTKHFPLAKEYFSTQGIPFYGKFDKPQRFSTLFQSVAAKYSRNSIFGFKSNPTRLMWLGQFVDIPATFSSECAWIDLKRINIVKQAFSFARAFVSGSWHSTANAPLTNTDVGLADLEPQVWRALSNILREERQIKEFYTRESIDPLRLSYEEILDSKHQVLARVTHRIDPAFDRSCLADITGSTQKLAGAREDEVEIAFMEKHISRISEIMAGRDEMTSQQITRLCQPLT